MITMMRTTPSAKSGKRRDTNAWPTTPATSATRSSPTAAACSTPGTGSPRASAARVRSREILSVISKNIYLFKGEEHFKATTSSCDKPLHVCCRHPDFPDPSGIIREKPRSGPETCEEKANSYQCGDTDADNTEDAIFTNDDCVFEPCSKPATQKCGRRNTFGVESASSAYKVSSGSLSKSTLVNFPIFRKQRLTRQISENGPTFAQLSRR